MLQKYRLITQWRQGMRALVSTDIPVLTQSNGPLVILQNRQHIHSFQTVKTSSNNDLYNVSTIMCRNYSNQSRRPNFFTKLIDNIKQEVSKNKEMKENLKKFREEAEKLEQSDALKKARAKYMTVESEASALKEKLGKVKDTVSNVIEEASKTDIAKKAGRITEEIGKSARDAAETISEKGQQLGSTETFKTITDATAAVRQELEQSDSRVYVAPKKLRKRLETPEGELRVYAADDRTMDVEVHKDSRFYENWEHFKNNNAYINKMVDWKMRYNESDNAVIRASRLLTDKVSQIFGGIFETTELSDALTEIVKLDPNFDKTKFLQFCETDIIPNVLEAWVRGELEILKDWCHQGPFNTLAEPIKQAKLAGLKYDSKILDIGDLDLLSGKIMEQGPVLIISFTCQQMACVRDKQNKIIEGDPEKVMRVDYIWALARDATIFDPKAAWRLLDIAATSTREQLV